MVRAFILGALGLVACGGPVEETLVDELRVVAAIPDLPEVGPGEALGAQVTVVDPAGVGFEALAWLCTPTGPPGSPCLEARRGRTGGWASAVGPDGRAEGLIPPVELAAFFTDEAPEVAVTLWVLTCEPGLCPIVTQAPDRIALQPGWEDLVAALSDPAALSRDLPLQGVALTRRSVRVSNRPVEARNRHPVFTQVPEAVIETTPEGEAVFSVQVEDDEPVSLYGYTTVGGFGAAEVEAEEGAAELSWFSGDLAEDQDRADLYVVAADGIGGEALWIGEGLVSGEAPVE